MIVSNTHYRKNDPITSMAAAKKVNYNAKCKEVFSWCKKIQGGFTWKDVENISGLDGVWKRFSDLKALGYIEEAGARRDGCRVFKVVR